MENTDESVGSTVRASKVRPVYVSIPSVAEDEIDLLRLWRMLRERWRLVGGVTALFAIAAVAYALLATPIYRAQVLLAPVTSSSMNDMVSQVGGLASLAGLNLNLGGDSMHAVAVLKSNEFAADFIQRENLLPILFADEWDPVAQRWRDPNPANHPDIRDGVRFFDKKVRSVAEEGRGGLVTLTVDWTDPDIAAEWAQKMVAQVNERIRARQIEELEQKLAYLNDQLAKATLVELRQAIARVVEDQISAMMLTQARTEYAFKVIDPAFPPKLRAWPKRTLIVIVLTALGFLAGAVLALVRATMAERELLGASR
jgi:uncharacterized protein involved in exopolysaccharide biosynthesis